MHLKRRFSKEFVFEWTEGKGFRVHYTAHALEATPKPIAFLTFSLL